MKKITLIITLIFLLSATNALAAGFYFGVKTDQLVLGQEFEVGVFLNSRTEAINAIEGVIEIPDGAFKVKDIRDGNSIMSIWLERPEVDDLSFSGIIPGGYIGDGGYLFSIILETEQLGEAVIVTTGERILYDEGLELKFERGPLKLTVAEGDIVEKLSFPIDEDPPEDFIPEVGRDDEIFDGQYFIVFDAKDKGSGIDHYEIREKWLGSFEIGESPYLLSNQKLDSKIFVKAIDKNNNERIVIVDPLNPNPWYKKYLLIIILIIVVVLGYAYKNGIIKKKKMNSKN